jgi:hypothetical protein
MDKAGRECAVKDFHNDGQAGQRFQFHFETFSCTRIPAPARESENLRSLLKMLGFPY